MRIVLLCTGLPASTHSTTRVARVSLPIWATLQQRRCCYSQSRRADQSRLKGYDYDW